MKTSVLLVEPDFPIPPKSKNHKNFLPIGLLKIGGYHKLKGDKVKLVRGLKRCGFTPDRVLITSLFTYWCKYVHEAAKFYHKAYPSARIEIGGVYASLMRKHCKKHSPFARVERGLYRRGAAEKIIPDYSLLSSNPHPVDYQILHTSRGCVRRCEFCGTWQIEPVFEAKKTIKDEIICRNLVFYDNNFLANPHIENILHELTELRTKKETSWCESQSGFDGRILTNKPHLGGLIKKAGFRYPRIAWDWGYSKYPEIKKQIDALVEGGYNPKDIFVFMLYNWEISFEEMEQKRIQCWKWKVQIADCRYRPLHQTFDNYNPRKVGQTNSDYYIHQNGGWTDVLVKQFRKNIRRQNICIRHGFPFYSRDFETKKLDMKVTKKTKYLKTKREKVQFLRKKEINFWFADKTTYS